MKYLSQLVEGEMGEIIAIEEGEATIKLMEMGCVPKEKIKLIKKEPFGGPLAIEVAGYVLSMRRTEAALIRILPLS